MVKELFESDPAIHCQGEVVDIDSITPNPQNPNMHPDDQLNKLAVILSQQGWREAITISRRSGFIVRGHGRYLAAKKAGFKKIPVEFQEYKDEETELCDLIADNRIAKDSIIDAFGLGQLLKKIAPSKQKGTGFQESEVAPLLLAEYERPKENENVAKIYESLRVTRDQKDRIIKVVQKVCIEQNKEVEVGEVLVRICEEWINVHDQKNI